MAENIRDRGLEHEFKISASRSSGPGGQNVNKVNTKVELRFDINASLVLTQEEKTRIFEKLSNHITNDGELLLFAQDSRSQLENREIAIEKCYSLLEEALKKQKRRRKTRVPAAVKKKRLDEKKKRSRLKADRGWKDE
ncbi:MAG: aminoacyl-tRNA hydrolase [Marinilabiliales bacterium]|nr:MAG: aminoacyl-tRNA hydrolase [Marinilabiliales bacterium]